MNVALQPHTDYTRYHYSKTLDLEACAVYVNAKISNVDQEQPKFYRWVKHEPCSRRKQLLLRSTSKTSSRQFRAGASTSLHC